MKDDVSLLHKGLKYLIRRWGPWNIGMTTTTGRDEEVFLKKKGQFCEKFINKFVPMDGRTGLVLLEELFKLIERRLHIRSKCMIDIEAWNPRPRQTLFYCFLGS